MVSSVVWITAVNSLLVRVYGELEFFLGSIKLITIVGLMLLMCINTLGGTPTPRTVLVSLLATSRPAMNEYLESGSLGRFLAFWKDFVQATFSYGQITASEIVSNSSPAQSTSKNHKCHQSNPTSQESSSQNSSSCPVPSFDCRCLCTVDITVIFACGGVAGTVSSSSRGHRSGVVEVNQIGGKYICGADFFFHSHPAIICRLIPSDTTSAIVMASAGCRSSFTRRLEFCENAVKR